MVKSTPRKESKTSLLTSGAHVSILQDDDHKAESTESTRENEKFG